MCYTGGLMRSLPPVAVVVLAILAELTLSRAGRAPELALFLGRFHPLVVHLPIGFFILVAAFEAATFHSKLRDRVEPALGLLVPLSAVAALVAFAMGQLLALEGGFPAGALGWHRRLTLLAVVGMAACWLLLERQRRDRPASQRWLYRGALVVTLGVLSLGAHFGGTMTRGESYLSKYAPAPLKPLLGTPEPEKPTKTPLEPASPVAEPLVFEHVVQPLLAKYCVDCHGAEKQKGKLRLDSLELMLSGGESGAAVVSGAPDKSLLVTRMLLPLSDDEHMPPKDEPSPPPEAIELIRFWIERGASPALKVRDALPPASTRSLLEQSLNGAASPSVAVPAGNTAAPAVASGSVVDAPSVPAARDQAEEPASATVPVVDEPAVAANSRTGPAVLAAYCEKCHGASKQKGKLRVDSVAALLKGGKSGTALVPGSPEQSSIVARIRLPLGDDEHMPPAKERQPSSAELAALVAWIRSGATTSSSASSSDKAPSVGMAPPVIEAKASDAPPAPSSEPHPVVARAATDATTDATTDVSGPPERASLASLPTQVAVFQAAIQPLLREKCGKCHIKPDPAGGLSVEQHAQLLEGGYSGAGIVPKNRAASVVMQRLVLPVSDSDRMPPEGEPSLSADEIELIGAWIDRGAPASEPVATEQLRVGGPEPVVARAGGCAACSVPGASLAQPRWLELQACVLAVGGLVLGVRRRLRALRQRSGAC